MQRVLMMAALIVLPGCMPAQEVAAPAPASPADGKPYPEMRRLFDAFIGTWRVSESFEISASHQGQARRGTASFQSGPGASLIEDYKSDGSAGPLSFLALIWWDQRDKVYRFLTCANNDGCSVRGTSMWEGNALVNSWQDQTDGTTTSFRDSFQDISRSRFRLVSEGIAGGKTIWRVITIYDRQSDHEP